MVLLFHAVSSTATTMRDPASAGPRFRAPRGVAPARHCSHRAQSSPDTAPACPRSTGGREPSAGRAWAARAPECQTVRQSERRSRCRDSRWLLRLLPACRVRRCGLPEDPEGRRGNGLANHAGTLRDTRSECMTVSSGVWNNNDMKRPLAATVWREGNWFVSQCVEIDVASQGATEDEALENLQEALELHFEPPQPTRPPKVVYDRGRGWGGLGRCLSAKVSHRGSHVKFARTSRETVDAAIVPRKSEIPVDLPRGTLITDARLAFEKSCCFSM
jgi:predicted RNase H-like HicB family nuclease